MSIVGTSVGTKLTPLSIIARMTPVTPRKTPQMSPEDIIQLQDYDDYDGASVTNLNRRKVYSLVMVSDLKL